MCSRNTGKGNIRCTTSTGEIWLKIKRQLSLKGGSANVEQALELGWIEQVRDMADLVHGPNRATTIPGDADPGDAGVVQRERQWFGQPEQLGQIDVDGAGMREA